jgi:hypothetical protein
MDQRKIPLHRFFQVFYIRAMTLHYVIQGKRLNKQSPPPPTVQTSLMVCQPPPQRWGVITVTLCTCVSAVGVAIHKCSSLETPPIQLIPQRYQNVNHAPICTQRNVRMRICSLCVVAYMPRISSNRLATIRAERLCWSSSVYCAGGYQVPRS